MRGSSTLAASAVLLLARPDNKADAHVFMFGPVARQTLHTSEYNSDMRYGEIEKHADAYNGGGPAVVKQRYLDRASAETKAKYGNGEYWPPARAWDLGEKMSNNNYYEGDDMAVSHGVCGDTPQSGDDNPIIYSTPNTEWEVLETYESGQIFEIDLAVTNHHWGHFEVFLCNTADMSDPDGVPKQSCFNKYPLDRAGDAADLQYGPVDPEYPGRYFLDPPCRGMENPPEVDQTRPQLQGVLMDGTVMHMRYKFPDITCEHCILMLRYHSGKGCRSPGYEEFNPEAWPSACGPDKEDWIEVTSHKCNSEDREWGNLFWNCADIALTSSGKPAPAPAPTPEPVSPTPEPVSPTPEPVSPTPEPVSPTPEPVSPTPEPISPTPEPVSPTPEPVSPTPEPVSPTPEPVSPTPEPISPTPEPTAEATPEPTAEATPKPVSPTTPSTPEPLSVPEEEYVGCFKDDKEDRVMAHRVANDERMTASYCREHCSDKGALYYGTQWSIECWCGTSSDEADYERHGTTTCDWACSGDESEACGGYDAYSLYKYDTACSEPVEMWEQCGGDGWTGSTCCEDGLECVVMGDGTCYSQCRPIEALVTPAPVTPEPQPTAKPVSPTTPSTPEPEPTPEPTSEPTPEPTPEPTSEPTPEPTTEPTDGADCKAVVVEAEDLSYSGDWEVVKDSDASGGEYLVWNGLEAEENNRDAADGDIITTMIDIKTAGTYRFRWRMRQPPNVASDRGNDSWLYFPDAARFGPEGTNDSYGGFIKVFGNAMDDFKYSGTADVNHVKSQIVIEFATAGTYEMQISGRSHGHQIDQIIVYEESLDVEDAVAACS